MAIGELNCPSMEYVYEMTWSEFMIRLHSYQRQQHNQWMKVRELAWITYIAPHQNPKKMKRSIKQFWPLDEKVNQPTDKMKMMMLNAQKEYLKQRAQKNGK